MTPQEQIDKIQEVRIHSKNKDIYAKLIKKQDTPVKLYEVWYKQNVFAYMDTVWFVSTEKGLQDFGFIRNV